jgi:branched-subunit amino acid transport protein
MTPIAPPSLLLLAADATATLTSRELDLPQSPIGWLLLIGGSVAVFLWVVWLYLRDTHELSPWWKAWLTILRISVLAALLVVALNPSDRTQKQAFRPSRVAIVVDTSLSMRHPADAPDSDASPGADKGPSRAEAIEQMFSKTPLIEQLRKQHEISIYTFDSRLDGPHRVYPLTATTTATGDGSDNGGAKPASPSKPAGDAKPETPLDWRETVRPRGLETRLGESLAELIRQSAGRTLSGIVVVTDGASNSGVDPVTAHDRAVATKTRLIAVGTGTTRQPVNLSIAEVAVPTDVAINDPYEIKVFVQGQGLEGRQVDVELLAQADGEEGDPALVEKKTVTLLEDGARVEVVFPRTPTIAGKTNYTVKATPVVPVAEFNVQDNIQTPSVTVFDRPTKVLLFAGGPMRDYQFVRNLLFRHKSFDVDVLLQTGLPGTSQESNKLLLTFPATREELYDYDAIIAFDPDWKAIPSDAIPLLYNWVADESGGLILVAGDVNTQQIASGSDGIDEIDDEFKPLRQLYPVVLSSYFSAARFDQDSSHPWPIAFTPEGQGAGFLQLTDDPVTSAARWKEFAGFYRAYPTGGHKAAARVYARFADPRAATEPPILMASQNVGRGQSFYLGSGEMWRLRSVSDADYDRFWIKLVREIAQGRTKKGVKRGSLRTESQKVTLGQTVRVFARLLDAQFKPMDAENVPFDLFDPTGRPVTPVRQLRREPSQPGEYVGDFRAALPGTYKLELQLPESRERLNAEVIVGTPKLEDENIRQNVRLLTELARDTGGQYLPLETAAAELPALLPNRGELFYIPERLRTLWDRDWVMYLLVGLLSAEWLTRKLLKLA